MSGWVRVNEADQARADYQGAAEAELNSARDKHKVRESSQSFRVVVGAECFVGLQSQVNELSTELGAVESDLAEASANAGREHAKGEAATSKVAQLEHK